MADPQIQGLPPGATVGQPVQADTPIQGLPPGATVGAPVQQDTPANTESVQPTGGASSSFEPESTLDKIDDTTADVIKGAGKGLMSTVEGLGHLMKKVPQVALAEKLTGHEIIPEAGLKAEDTLTHPQGTAQMIGYGGETLAEFLLGDEALKGMSMAEKFGQISGVMKILEKSPRLMKMLQLGTDVGKAQAELGPEEQAALKKSPMLARLVGTGMDALRQGTTQTAQTAVKTGGDVKQAAEQGAETGVASGVLGGAFGLLGRAAEKAGDAGKAVKEASETGAAAPTKKAIGDTVAGQIQDANAKMHADFESGIQDLKGKIGDVTTPYKGSPIQTAAKEALQGKTEEKGVLGDEFQKLAGGTDKSQKLLTALADDKKTGDLTISELVQRRQELGKRIGQLSGPGVSGAEVADRSIYQSLRDGIDQTIDSLTKNSGKPEASQDYEALRGAYKDKVNLFKEPLIRAMQDGDLDSAGKYLLAGGKTLDKINTLEQVIGTDGLKKFGQSIAQSTLADATSESGQINPAQFTKAWKKIDSLSPEVKSRLFDMAGAQSELKQMSSDLKSAASYQKLVRLGVISAASSAGASHPVLGGVELALGLLGKSTGVDGTKLLDTVANHPTMWKTMRWAGDKAAKASLSPTARVAKSAAAYGAGNALGNVLQGANEPLSQPEDNQ